MATASKSRKQAPDREVKRLAKEEVQRRRRREQRRRALLIYAGVTATVVLFAAGILWPVLRPKPGISVAGQGAIHVAPSAPHPAYNSNPPASGWHYPGTAPWGFQLDEVPDELVIHNLEHGGIWITYKDRDDAAVVDPLIALAREFPRSLIVTHRPKNDSRIAAVAWQRILKLDVYDERAIAAFIRSFRNRGPERMVN